jgi:arylsulfatase A-like enzyme
MPPRNLLFLFTDEQRYDTLAAYGNARIEMPNLDRLAGEAVVFDRAYVTQPVCTPSRSTLLTGLYPHTTGCIENNVPLPDETLCFPQLISDGRYVSAYYGKWHLGDEIFRQHGFDDWRSIDDMYRRYYRPGRDRSARSTYHHFLVEHGRRPEDGSAFRRGEAARLPEELSKPAYLAREASRFLRANRARPFVLFVNFLEPHMPFTGPRDEQYAASEVPLPANFEAAPTHDQPLKARLLRRHYATHGFEGLDLSTSDGWRRLIARYWGLCSLVDTHVGTILDALGECGLADSTIVVFTSDHGDMMGSHQLLAKCVMFEEAVRVPLLVRLPGRQACRRVSCPVSQIDLVPTLLDLMDQPVGPHLQGRSLRGLLEGGAEAGDDVFIEWNGSNNGLGDRLGEVSIPDDMLAVAERDEIAAAFTGPVRTIVTPDGWKFSCGPSGERELYNLNDDPHETSNLAAGGGYRALMADLLGRIRRWQGRTGDAVNLPELPPR